ncbi:hypothetical protein [Azospirillum palustre]
MAKTQPAVPQDPSGTPGPQIDTDRLTSLLMPMLGLGACRTFAKVKGVAR